MAVDTLPDVPMDWGPQITPKASIDAVRYGDGYEQRRPTGINHVLREASVSWSTLFKDEYDQIHPFLLARLGLIPFLWTPPGDTVPRKWICAELAGGEASAIVWQVSAKFREVVA